MSYVVDPREDNADAGVVADSTYWLSGLAVRDEAAGTGTVEALSQAFGVAPAEPLPVAQGAGALTGGGFGPLPFVERRVDVAPAAGAPAADRLRLRVANVSRVVVDPARARLTCAADVQVESDGPVEVVLAGCDRTVTAGPSAGGATTAVAGRATPRLAATGPPAVLPVLGLLGLAGAAHLRR